MSKKTLTKNDKAMLSETSDAQRIKPYDFKRPDKFFAEQLRAVSIVYERYARLASASLSARFRSVANVHLRKLDQLTYEEFIRSVSTPVTLAVINMDPLQGKAVLKIDQAITFSMLDRLLGGAGQGIKEHRDLMEIEQSVLEEVVVQILADMGEAWTPVANLRPNLQRIENDPLFVLIVPPTEMLLVVTLGVKIENIEGTFTFCIPHSTVQPILSNLSLQHWFANSSQAEVLPCDILKKITCQSFVDLSNTILGMTADQLAALGKGDVLPAKDSEGFEATVQRLKEKDIEFFYRTVQPQEEKNEMFCPPQNEETDFNFELDENWDFDEDADGAGENDE